MIIAPSRAADGLISRTVPELTSTKTGPGFEPLRIAAMSRPSGEAGRL